jgi:hypothetical protein
LGVNISFFGDARKPFLGDEDPTASIKSAFSDWDITAAIANFYPKVQAQVGDVPEEKLVPKLEPEKTVPKEEPEAPKPDAPIETLKTATVLPALKPAVAKSAMAEQFKPITTLVP